MREFESEYNDLKGYILNYDNDVDNALQMKCVKEYWDRHCVVKKSLLGFSYSTHNETAKDLWSELDSMVIRKIQHGKRYNW